MPRFVPPGMVLAALVAVVWLVIGPGNSGNASASGTPNVFPVPARNGLTIGPSGTTDPAVLAAAQAFEVESVSAWDVATQRWWVFIPGAPAHVNAESASHFATDSFVWLKRRDTSTLRESLPAGFDAPNTAQVLPTPPGSGMTLGFAGTTDPASLAAAQPFEVQSISAFDVVSQRWLTFVPGAPAAVNTLTTSTLRADSVIFIRSRGLLTATPAGGFTTLPVGATLPSGAECATRVRPAPEVRPGNATYNATRGTSSHDSMPRVDGNFTGTTDEILQWVACKWGIDEDVVRAQAAIESYWTQTNLGDTSSDQSTCHPDLRTSSGPCPQSTGILQVRYPYHAEAFEDGNAIYSTAYNVDYTYAIWRECYEGVYTWLNTAERGAEYAAGDMWGCLGTWFSGRWYTEPAVTYIGRVQGYVDDRVWETSDFISFR